MGAAAISLAILKFIFWEAATLAAAVWLVRKLDVAGAERWLLIVAAQVTIESSIAALFSFTGVNSAGLYLGAALACIALAQPWRFKLAWPRPTPLAAAFGAALAVPLVVLSFRPTQEIDSINYLHYLIEWMANRSTPYTFATNYVAFWELSFLPAWTFTGVDFFFPLLALKAVVLMGLALWLAGRELDLDGPLLAWTIAAAVAMRHYWYEYSGVGTLKNDVLHGVGFVLMTLVAMRAWRRRLTAADVALLALGVGFSMVKYTGIFLAAPMLAAVAWRERRNLRAGAVLAVLACVMLTSGHYYLHNLLQHGSPFYPFQINLGPIHLPGTADLSDTSILHSLRDERLWRAFFLPAGGLSPAGLLFPVTLVAALALALGRVARAVWRSKAAPIDVMALCLLAGWLLYFRSVYSASASPGDLGFVLNSLNSLRYVDGVLAVSELFLVAMLPSAVAGVLVGINLASRLWILYGKIPLALFPAAWIVAACALVFLAMLGRRTRWVAAALFILATPWIVDRNRSRWTTYWNGLKPALAEVRSKGLAELAMEDGGYFAGHVVAAGNPVNPTVRSLLSEEIDKLSPAERPRYLAVLPTPGSVDWQVRYGDKLAAWGYRPWRTGAIGAVLELSGNTIEDNNQR
jgi:hypothetical protein